MKSHQLFHTFSRETEKEHYLTPQFMQTFCNDQSLHLPNMQLKVMNGKVFWRSCSVNGYEIQSHVFAPNCRILNSQGERIAWGSDASILHPLIRYIRTKKHTAHSPKSRYGLVFSGGGAKGSYEIGVWKYLREIGIDREICGISGASVGALNALLFAQGDFKKAVRVWLSATQKTLTHITFEKPHTKISHAMKNLRASASHEHLTEYARFPGPLKQDYLEKLILGSIDDWKRITSPDKDIFLALSKVSSLHKNRLPHLKALQQIAQAEYFCLAGMRPREVRQTALASAAIPAVVTAPVIDGKIYVDGGVSDNTPVRPLLEAGYQKIIVVHLDAKSATEEKRFLNSIHGLPTGNVTFFHVYPSKNLTPADFVLLNRKRVKALMKLGLHDARTQLKDLR